MRPILLKTLKILALQGGNRHSIHISSTELAKKLGIEYIYESPDGGETVYQREVGNYTAERQIVSKSEKAHIEEEFKRRNHYITPEAVKLCWKHRGLQKAWEKYIMLLELYGHSEE